MAVRVGTKGESTGSNMANNYGAAYYEQYAGAGHYMDNLAVNNTLKALGRWLTNLAPKLQLDVDKSSHLDVGCAFGTLVSTMQRLGWNSYGVDSSEYAIDNCLPDVKDSLILADGAMLTDTFAKKFDIITCIEVAEHMTEDDAKAMIGQMCSLATGYVVFSSDQDTNEPTHINVHPQVYWDSLFAENGFVGMHHRFNRIPWAKVYVNSSHDYMALSRLLESNSRHEVLERDRFGCFLCGKNGVHVHEIVPRSAFGRSTMHICYSVKNRVCLCPEHHGPAHTIEQRRLLIALMKTRYGYEYNEQIFQRYQD